MKANGQNSKVWVLCACPECNNEFIAQFVTLDGKGGVNNNNPDNLFNLNPLPEDLHCPYCGVKNDVYATHFPKVVK